jgi:hypothetical protein
MELEWLDSLTKLMEINELAIFCSCCSTLIINILATLLPCGNFKKRLHNGFRRRHRTGLSSFLHRRPPAAKTTTARKQTEACATAGLSAEID